MDVEQFLVRQGWKKGEGLRPGAIKNALLVKHRKDNKGLGFNPQASEGWWERVFNGHLQSLDVSKAGSAGFSFDEEKRRRETSPLYAHFRSGGLLKGSIQSAEDEKIGEDSKHKKSKRKSKDSEKKHKSKKRKRSD